jgi:hypothetical protein
MLPSLIILPVYQSYINTNASTGVTWSAGTGTGNRNWVSIASSQNGDNVVASTETTKLWRSTNYGASWTELTNSHLGLSTVDCSSDGTKLAVAAYSSYLKLSTDSGASWTNVTGQGTLLWTCVYMSGDGGIIIAGANAGNLHISTNAGSSWTTVTSMGTKNWRFLVGTPSASKLAAICDTGAVYLSTDGGASWVLQSWTAFRLAISPEGSVFVKHNGFYIDMSEDDGATWTRVSGSLGAKLWSAIYVGTNGVRIAGAVSNEYIYLSSDRGATWVEQTGVNYQDWKVLAGSEKGDRMLAGATSSPTIIATPYTLPSPALYADVSSGSSSSAIPNYTVKFSEAVTGFTSSSITVTGGTITSFAGSGDTYTFTLSLITLGEKTVTIPATASWHESNTHVFTFDRMVITKPVTGLNHSTLYYFNVVVKDSNGNKSVYAKATQLTTDIVNPTAGNGGLLTLSGKTETTITVNWTKATDVGSAQANLQYLVYYSTSATLDSVAEIEANGTAFGTYAADINTKTITGLTPATIYYYNVIVKDETGNKTAYSKTTLDVVPPVAGNSGTLTTSLVGGNTLTLNWTKATDNVNPALLQYLPYQSLSPNITTVSDALANGTPIGTWTTDINTKVVTGLTESTTYYFNVLVKDSENTVAYTQLQQATTNGDITVIEEGNNVVSGTSAVWGTLTSTLTLTVNGFVKESGDLTLNLQSLADLICGSNSISVDPASSITFKSKTITPKANTIYKLRRRI